VIRFEADPVLEFVQEHVVFRNFLLSNLRLRPHGPVEMIGLLPSALYGHRLLRCHIEMAQESAHTVRVTLTPAKVIDNLDRLVHERRDIRITYRPDRQRFVCDITVTLDFRQDIRGGEGLAFTAMPQQPGDRYAVVEFDDPLLSGGVGPQVPMTQDWTGLPEPILCEQHYTQGWRKRYRAVILPTLRRGLRRLVFNRTVNGVQQFYNRTLPCTTPRQPFLFEKADGRYVRFTPLFDAPASHHICEWGYDMHLYAMLEPAAPDVLFRQGQQVVLRYQFEEIEADEAPAAYRAAPDAEIEPDERARADRPIYEEPVCAFQRSALDCPDQYGWTPAPGCTWDRHGGRTDGHGALVIRTTANAAAGPWRFNHLGPSYACNPIPPDSRHRVSAWVRADEPAAVSLEFTLVGYNGPAMYSSRREVVSTATLAADAPVSDGWRRLEFVSEPSPSYAISGGVAFAYTGRGEARLSELSVERL